MEYEIIRKIFYEDNGVLYIEFYYWINGERSKANISIGSSNINNWKKELDNYLESLSKKEDVKKVFDKINKDIKINQKKEFK